MLTKVFRLVGVVMLGIMAVALFNAVPAANAQTVDNGLQDISCPGTNTDGTSFTLTYSVPVGWNELDFTDLDSFRASLKQNNITFPAGSDIEKSLENGFPNDLCGAAEPKGSAFGFVRQALKSDFLSQYNGSISAFFKAIGAKPMTINGRPAAAVVIKLSPTVSELDVLYTVSPTTDIAFDEVTIATNAYWKAHPGVLPLSAVSLRAQGEEVDLDAASTVHDLLKLPAVAQPTSVPKPTAKPTKVPPATGTPAPGGNPFGGANTAVPTSAATAAPTDAATPAATDDPNSGSVSG